jgi:hypothetical protein
MGLPLPLRIGRSLCASGLAHRRGRWAAGKMPAPHYNQFAIRRRCGVDAKGGAPLRPYDSPPLAIRDSPYFPFAIRRISPLATRHSLLAVFRHSLFAIRRISPLAARRSPSFTIRYSPFAIRDSPYFSARYSPSFSGGEPVSAGLGRSYWSGGVTSVILRAHGSPAGIVLPLLFGNRPGGLRPLTGGGGVAARRGGYGQLRWRWRAS